MRFRHFALSTSGLVVALLLDSCSLTRVADFELGQCRTDEDCRMAFNEARGYYPECAAFKCVESGTRKDCVEVVGEVCDGEDNDCDRLIDEAEGGEAVLGVTVEVQADGLSLPLRGSVAASEGFGGFAYLAQEQSQASVVALGGSSLEAKPVEMWTQADPEGDPLGSGRLTELDSGCYEAEGGLGTCNVADLAVAAGEQHAFFASVNVRGCNAGEIRVGVIDREAPEELLDRGRGARDPSYRGVATRGTICTDNGSAACRDAKEAAATNPDADPSEVCGASAPAVAALTEQALVVFSGLPQSRDTCSDSAVPLFGLGVHADVGSFGEEFIWSNPTADGEPEEIGRTLGGAPPAVLAVPGAGFIVGFGNEEGHVELLWVPEQPGPPPNDGLTCSDPLCDNREGFETEPLSGVSSLWTFDDADDADGIRLALLPLGEDTFALSLTWVEGCARQDADFEHPAYAKLLSWSNDGARPELDFEGPTIELGPTSQVPISLPAESGFVVPGFERGDTTATPETSGGFYVLTQPSDTQAVRLAAFDGERVDDEELLELPEEARYLVGHDEASYVAYHEAESELVVSSFACAGAEP